MHRVEFARRAKKQLDALPVAMGDRITIVIANLGNEPRAGADKLTGYDLWRIRVGDYRVIYSVDDTEQLIVIVRVAKRGDVYRRL